MIKSFAINGNVTNEYSPEKAGVGGSIPSLATIESITSRPSLSHSRCKTLQLNSERMPEFAALIRYFFFRMSLAAMRARPRTIEEVVRMASGHRASAALRSKRRSVSVIFTVTDTSRFSDIARSSSHRSTSVTRNLKSLLDDAGLSSVQCVLWCATTNKFPITRHPNGCCL